MSKNALELKVRADGDTAVVSSSDLAEIYGKQHSNVLRDIRDLEIPSELKASWFRPTTVLDSYGRPQPAVDLTRDGYALLAMGWTGEKAMAFKVRYIQAFNEMEASLRELEITDEGMRRLGNMQEAIVSKLLASVVMPMMTQMREENARAMAEHLAIAGGHDPSRHSVSDMRRMVEHLIDLKIPAKGRRVLSSRCSQKVVKYSIVKGKRDLVQADHSKKLLFHVSLLREWMDYEGDVIIREWREKTLGQTVFDFAAAKSKKNAG